MTQPPLFLAPGEGKRVSLGESQFIFKIDGEATGGAYSLLEYHAPPGVGSPFHTHRNESETFYILAGVLTFQLGEERVEAAAGATVSIPRGLRHAFANHGDGLVRALILAAPAGLECYFKELGEMVGEGGASAERVAALNARYGLDFEG
jgi:quercetin dioxygenase-like cupin family protein